MPVATGEVASGEGEEEGGGGVLLPCALALTVRLTPTLLQICRAKVRTSGGREEKKSRVSWSFAFSRAFRLLLLSWWLDLGVGDGAGRKGFERWGRGGGGITHFANQTASTGSPRRLGLH